MLRYYFYFPYFQVRYKFNILKSFQRNILNTIHLRRKCWSVVNFIDAVSAPHSSSEICPPFFENAGTRPIQTQHKDNSFHGKRNIAKFTHSTIWGVQLKSGDN
jgi:hypothetical protein